MPTRWCPICRAEYRAGVTACADCGASLVEEADLPPALRAPTDTRVGPPSAGFVGDGERHEPITYDLSDWEPPRRTVLDNLLEARLVPHRWEDGVLVVSPRHEHETDTLIDDVDAWELGDNGTTVGDETPLEAGRRAWTAMVEGVGAASVGSADVVDHVAAATRQGPLLQPRLRPVPPALVLQYVANRCGSVVTRAVRIARHVVPGRKKVLFGPPAEKGRGRKRLR